VQGRELLQRLFVAALQDLLFNGIQISIISNSMQCNTGDFEGIFTIYSMSIISVLSFLHYLFQDLIFNGNQIDFVHQQRELMHAL
jgi:hypothetical protein